MAGGLTSDWRLEDFAVGGAVEGAVAYGFGYVADEDGSDGYLGGLFGGDRKSVV